MSLSFIYIYLIAFFNRYIIIVHYYYELTFYLFIFMTRITSWIDINQLSSYPALEQLRMSHVPLFVGMSASEARAMVVGRLARLCVFNASGIKPRERRDAEKAYLRSIIREQSALSSSSSSSCVLLVASVISVSDGDSTAHPRYTELMQCYADEMLPTGRNDSTGPRSLASELIAIKITNVTSSNTGSHGVGSGTEKRLPMTLTVGKLRGMMSQLYSVDPDCQQLALRVDKESIPIVLDDDESSLGFYGAVDGSEIFVNEV